MTIVEIEKEAFDFAENQKGSIISFSRNDMKRAFIAGWTFHYTDAVEVMEQRDRAVDVIKKLIADIHSTETFFNYTSQAAISAEKFLEELKK